jgi:biotin carboxyl carrier protein
MEAMKMEHVIRANRDGEIMDVFCSSGETVGSNFVLVELCG